MRVVCDVQEPTPAMIGNRVNALAWFVLSVFSAIIDRIHPALLQNDEPHVRALLTATCLPIQCSVQTSRRYYKPKVAAKAKCDLRDR